MGSSCPKSPTRTMEMLPKVCSFGSRPASLKQRRFACCSRKCMRAKKARPMKDTSSTTSKTTVPQVLSSLRYASPCNSAFHAALGKIWNPEHAVIAPNPMLKAATPVYAVSWIVASTPDSCMRRRACCKTFFRVVDFPLPAEPSSHARNGGGAWYSPVSITF